MRVRIDPEERFWKYVVQHEWTDCWVWVGVRVTRGYGRFWNGYRQIPAHWFLLSAYPYVKGGYEACHHCDNPMCVNPDHIFIGTHKENFQDCRAKGRLNPNLKTIWKNVRQFARGESSGTSVLTEDQVRQIRASKKHGDTRELAKKFGVAPVTIYSIRYRKTWKHI